MNVKDLNTMFSFQKENHSVQIVEGEAGILLIKVNNEQATSTISLQGAQVLSWIPAGEDEVIWVSSDADFAAGKSVRGGIPICWPWFGAHDARSDLPSHGFARIVMWQLTDVRALSAGETQIIFTLDTSQLGSDIRAMWPHEACAEYRITISKTLTLELTTTNNSDHTIMHSEALHTYFNISSIQQILVSGLDGRDYLDKTEGFRRKSQTGDIAIESEVDRVYLNTVDDVIINDRLRKILIKKQGSHSTVVWNPWHEAAEKMGDMGIDGYQKMLCVESANAAENVVSIDPGKSHKMLVIYELEKA